MQTTRFLLIAALVVTGLVALPVCGFAYLSPSGVFDAAGSRSTNASHSTFLTAGQGTPPGCTTNGEYINQSGFMQTFVMFPLLDYDGDGIADENDPDDDNDGLPDSTELAGAAFQPVTPTDMFAADSDGDGSGDPQEMQAGTNPTDQDSLFEVSAASLENGQLVISWTGRGDLEYEVVRALTPQGLLDNPTVVHTVTMDGGSGEWKDTNSATTNVTEPEGCFYGIRLVH